jgi:hypothetical protein
VPRTPGPGPRTPLGIKGKRGTIGNWENGKMGKWEKGVCLIDLYKPKPCSEDYPSYTKKLWLDQEFRYTPCKKVNYLLL